MTRAQLLEPLARLRTDEVVVTTMGVVRSWGTLSSHALDFASADSAMGHAADLALGIALARPDRRVLCLNGDGSMLMSLGTLVTIVQASARNLILFVVENGTYEITGNQTVPGAGRTDFSALARAAGFTTVHSFGDAAGFARALPQLLQADGPVFVSVHVEPGTEGPIRRHAAEPAPYLRESIADSARRLRSALSKA